MFCRLFLIWSFSYLQVTRTYISAWISSNFAQIPLLTTELAALERLKNWCRHFFSGAIDQIHFKFVGNEDMHNISNDPKVRSFWYLQVMRTYIKAWTSSNFGQIPLLTWEFAALERLKNWCCHFLAHLSRRLTRWAYSIAMVRRPSVVVRRHRRRPSSSTLSNLNISEAIWPILIKFYMSHHWGGGKAA